MKKLFLSFFAIVLLSAVVFCADGLFTIEASAAEITESGSCGENAYWTLDTEGTLTVSGSGEMTSYPSLSDSDSVRKIVVSSEITKLCEDAFSHLRNAEAVVFSENSKLEIIDRSAFACCSSLKEVTVPSSVTRIDNAAFAGCESLERVTFEDNSQLTELGSENYYSFFYNGAFESCVSLVDIRIPATVRYIRCCAFACCEKLEVVTFEKGTQLEAIDGGAFCETAITELVIPASVSSIGENAFNSCMSLESVSFEENSRLRSLGGFNWDTEETDGYSTEEGIFGCCKSLKNVSFPENIEFIGAYVFNQCIALESIDLREYSKLWQVNNYSFAECKSLKTFYFPDGLRAMGKGVLRGCESLTEIIIPESIQKLRNSAFSGCSSLKKVVFTSECNLQKIDETAFYSCVELTEIQLPPSVTYIGDYAFGDCRKLKEIELPKNTEYVGEFAFSTTAIKEIHIPAAVSHFGVTFNFIEKFTVDSDNMYYSADENGVLYNKDKTVLVQYPADLELQEFTIPDGVQSIGDFSFALCRNLDKIIMPDSVTEIQEAAFAYSFWIKEIVMSQKLETIGNSAFSLCFSLRELDIPASVTDVADYTFSMMFSLEKVRIYNTTLDFSNTELGLLYYTSDSTVERQEICELYIDFYYYSTCYDLDYINEKYGSEEALLETLREFEEKMDNVLRTDLCTVYCYEGAAVEEYLKENNIKYQYFCEHSEEIIPATDSDCINEGNTQGVKCSLCDEILVAPEKIPAKGHSAGTAVKENEVKATCSTAAYYEEVVRCDICKAEISRMPVTGETLPHTQEEIPALASTCTTTGLTAGVKCTTCGDILVAQQIIPLMKHIPDVTDNIAPEIGADGYTGDTVCSVCGELLQKGEKIPALEAGEGEETVDCDHLCHHTGILSILWKLLNFFNKFFGTNPICECGAAHY